MWVHHRRELRLMVSAIVPSIMAGASCILLVWNLHHQTASSLSPQEVPDPGYNPCFVWLRAPVLFTEKGPLHSSWPSLHLTVNLVMESIVLNFEGTGKKWWLSLSPVSSLFSSLVISLCKAFCSILTELPIVPSLALLAPLFSKL